MKDWKIRRFCVFSGPGYECSLGLGGLSYTCDTLAGMKKWLIKFMGNEEAYFWNWWQIDDLKKGVTVLSHEDTDLFVDTLFQIKARAHLKLIEKQEEDFRAGKARAKDPDRLPE